MIRTSLRTAAAAVLALALAACSDAATPTEARPSEAPSENLSTLAASFVSVSGGFSFTCGSTLGGAAYCWGSNDFGKLGTGGSAPRDTPGRVQGLSGVTGASAGSDHACAATLAGDVYCWGANYFGQLGNGTLADAATPVRVRRPAGVRFVSVTAGAFQTCALAADLTAWCWGDNSLGELGNGTATSSTTPVRVQSAVRFASLASGDGAVHVCAVDVTGNPWCWGDNSAGQLGTGTAGGASNVPVRVQEPAGVSLIGFSGAGVAHTCAVSSAGEAFCWGDNSVGQLGTGNTTPSAAPVRAATAAHFTSVTPGWFHTCGATSGAGAQCWGDNSFGKVGNGQSGNQVLTPATVVGSQGFGRMDPGADHSCTRARDGRAYCWGRGTSGELGQGANADSPTPVQVVRPGSVSPSVAPAASRASGSLEAASGRARFCEVRKDAAQLTACS